MNAKSLSIYTVRPNELLAITMREEIEKEAEKEDEDQWIYSIPCGSNLHL